MSNTTVQETRAGWDWKLWVQWLLANAVGETVGLGGTLLISGLLLMNAQQTIGVVPAAALAVLAGTFIDRAKTHQYFYLKINFFHLSQALCVNISYTLPGSTPCTAVETFIANRVV